MNPIFNIDEPALSKTELAEAVQDARKLHRLSTKRALYATGALFLSCAFVVPFSEGHSLHAYAEPFARILTYLSMALLVPFVICVGMAINSWFYLRSLRKIEL